MGFKDHFKRAKDIVLTNRGKLIKDGISPRRACQVAVTWALTDDFQVQRSVDEVISSVFE